MTDQDRGAYTPPTDAPLTFDARMPRGDRTPQAPVTLIVSAAVLVALIVAMVIVYRSGVRGSGQPPQVVGAPVGETKAPPSSAQPSNPAAGLQVYKSEATPPGEVKGPAPAFVPPPETAAPRPAARAVESSAADAPPPPATPPAHLRATETPTPAASAAKPVAELPAKSPPLASASALHNVVQIGAFSSPAVADKGWNDIAAILPGQMEGKTKKLEQITKDGKIFFRTYVGGFTSKADADAFCASLKAAGKSCIVR